MTEKQQLDCTPRCPWCNTARHVSSSATTLRAWYCGKCRREFEPEDDGDLGYGRPERRLERQEREAEQRAAKIERFRTGGRGR